MNMDKVPIRKIFYPEGKVKKIENFSPQSKLANGRVTLFNKGGKVIQIGYKSNGKKNGAFKTFHENGMLKKIEVYSHGKKVGEALHFDKSGKLIGITYPLKGNIFFQNSKK